MTRRDQTIRAWIERDRPGIPWISKVSCKRKLHSKSTGSMIRKAALEFNRLHTLAVIKSACPHEPTPPARQSELFPIAS